MPTPQRLPIVNGDDGAWGDIFNQYIKKEHYDDGTDNAVNGGHQKITIRAGTTAAGTAPLKFTTGTNLTTAEAGAMEYSSSVLYFTPSGTTRQTVLLDLLPDSQNIAFGTSTGTKIGTSTSQKIGFYNATPIVQPSGNVLTALSNLGLISSPTLGASTAHTAFGNQATVDGTGPVNSHLQDLLGTLTEQTVLGVQEIITGTPTSWNNGITSKLVANFGATGASSTLVGIENTTAIASGNAQPLLIGAGIYNSFIHRGTNTVTTAYGEAAGIYNTSTGTITTAAVLVADGITNTGGGTVTNAIGLKVIAQTVGTNNYGVTIEGAGTQTLWVSNLADTTTAAGGIAFGLSHDTNLYRSAVGTLKTDTAFTVGTNLTVTGTTLHSDNVTMADAKNIILNTTTGTKIGTGTTQKLGFYNATPIVQPTGDIVTALSNLGLVASGTVTPTGAVILAPTNSTTNIIQPTGDFKPLIVKGSASQTADLQEWQNSSGTILTRIDATGYLGIGTGTTAAVSKLDIKQIATDSTSVKAMSFSNANNSQASSESQYMYARMGEDGNYAGYLKFYPSNNTENNWAFAIHTTPAPGASSKYYFSAPSFNSVINGRGDSTIMQWTNDAANNFSGTMDFGQPYIGGSAPTTFSRTNAWIGNTSTSYFSVRSYTSSLDLFNVKGDTGKVTLFSNNTTYTAAPDSGIYKSGTFTSNFVNAQAPYFLEDTSTYVMQQSASPYGMGIGTYFHPIFKNANGVAANLGPYFASGSGATMQADGATITQPLTATFADTTTYNVINAGVITQTQHDHLRATITVSTGATVTNRAVAHMVDATVTGTLTNSVGLEVDAQTGGTNIYGMRSALALSGTTRYHLYLSGTALTYINGSVGIASNGTPGTVEKLRVNAPATGDNTANVIFTASTTGARALVVQGQNGPSVPAFDVQNGSGTSLFNVMGSAVAIADGGTIASGSTTGMKIGTATTQKIAFFNSTPIVQPANTVAIDDTLANLGLRATGGTANFTTSLSPRAGTTGAGTAPIKFTSGSLMTSAEAGALEFLTDTLYFTQTTSTTRKKIAAYDDTSGATGDVYYRDASGYFVRLGIGSGNQVLGVSGGIPAWAQAIFATATKTATTYTITSTDTVIIADATSNGVTITLPAAASFTGYRFYVKRKDATANTVTIARTGADTIDGATSQTLNAQYTSATFVSDGSNWYII